MRLQEVVEHSRSQKTTVANLEYISGMLEELTKMAPAEAGPLLPHLIGMARLEAVDAAGKLVAKNHRPGALDASIAKKQRR